MYVHQKHKGSITDHSRHAGNPLFESQSASYCWRRLNIGSNVSPSITFSSTANNSHGLSQWCSRRRSPPQC